MTRIFITLILSNVWFLTMSQTDTSVMISQDVAPVHIDRNFNHKYQQSLWRIKRAYPLALEAKKIIDRHETELAEIEKKRKKKKYSKELNKELKEDFTYILKDLYVEEGAMLMKLIHRETGMTIDEILRKYKSNSAANITRATFAFYGHDTRSEFEPNGEDWVTEIVIQDIESGKIAFNKKVKSVSKSEYKQGMKEYRQGTREYRRANRKHKKKPSK